MSYLFHGQRSNEDVVLVTKQHPLVLLRPLLISAAILLIPFAANIFLPFNTLMGVIVVTCVLAAFGWGFLAWYSWNNSVALLTTERVVTLQQRGLLEREFSECKLSSIQQVSHQVNGLLRTLFGYGTISIVTGGAQGPFYVANVPSPYEIQQEIQRVASGEGFKEDEV